MEINDRWQAGEGEMDGTPFLIRYRPDLGNFASSGLYRHRMEIIWQYNSPYPALMPDEEEYDHMREVEDLLADALEHDQLAVLAFVYTGHNQHVWHWYTRDVKEAGLRMNNALKGWDEAPIELYVEEDADWDEYHSMLGGAVDEGAEE